MSSDSFDECRQSIVVGSQSFSMAARLFNSRERDGALLLYSWCRYCDDVVDGQDRGFSREVAHRSTVSIAELQTWTRSVFDLTVSLPPEAPRVFEALRSIVEEFEIPSSYALDLLEGMASDSRGERCQDLVALKLYCYRVAGTVGLMMSHVMGLSDPRALKQAADLGIALQLTNIARDVMDDARAGRVYLPADWLLEEGILADPVSLLLEENRAGVVKVVRRVLREADQYYSSGLSGLRYLSFRSALAVSVAAEVYGAIGMRVLARGDRAWDERVVVSSARKILCILLGLTRACMTIPSRLLRPWSAARIDHVWRYSES